LLLKITPKDDLEIELDERDIQGVRFTITHTRYDFENKQRIVIINQIDI